MAIVIEQPSYPRVAAPAEVQPMLAAMPKLLAYRSDADPDAEFIPKTIAGFAGGMVLMGVCLVLAELMYLHPAASHDELVSGIMFRVAFLIGITGVAVSLLLVGLKVRADHTGVDLFARHWLNSITTGGIYAMLIWGPWLLYERGVMVNRFIAAAAFMMVMSYPAIAAKWTITRHPAHETSGVE